MIFCNKYTGELRVITLWLEGRYVLEENFVENYVFIGVL
jgi:hypothetical protein